MSEITDFARIYWKLLDLTDFTDFNEITNFTGKYQVSPCECCTIHSVSLTKLVKSKGILAHLQKTCLQAEKLTFHYQKMTKMSTVSRECCTVQCTNMKIFKRAASRE